MVFSDKNLADFKDLYRKQFGIELSDQEVLEQASKLVCLVKATYKPILKDQND